MTALEIWHLMSFSILFLSTFFSLIWFYEFVCCLGVTHLSGIFLEFIRFLFCLRDPNTIPLRNRWDKVWWLSVWIKWKEIKLSEIFPRNMKLKLTKTFTIAAFSASLTLRYQAKNVLSNLWFLNICMLYFKI